eukprot:10018446-Karenia_brevis.AAC.1
MLGNFWRQRSVQEIESEASDDEVSEPDNGIVEETDMVEGETWVEWLRRCTRIVESALSELRIDDWVVSQRRRKWRLAGHTARREDGRWSTAVCHWTPVGGYRQRGHPHKRWSDDLDGFLAE